MAYTPPSVTDLGALADLTLDFNKTGRGADALTAIIPGLVGTITNLS